MFHCTSCGTEYVTERAECADCGGAVAAGESPRFEPGRRTPEAAAAPAPRTAAPAPARMRERPDLPASGLRHCPECSAEYASAATDCVDCDVPLHPGPSPRFADDTPARGGGSDQLSPDDFVPLAQVPNGWQADMLCGVLSDAGIATMIVTARGRRMRAPGREPIGPAPAENEAVEILVFPESLDEGRIVLQEAIDEGTAEPEEIPVPSDGPGAAKCGVDCEHVAPAAAAGTPAVVFVLGGLVVAAGLAAVFLWH